MSYVEARTGDRIRAALPVVGVHLLLLGLLLNGLSAGQREDTLVPPTNVTILPVLTEPAVVRTPLRETGPDQRRQGDPRPQGAAAPAGLDARPTALAIPDPIVPPLTPPTITEAPVRGDDDAASSGATPLPSPGTGGGGVGEGTGSGRFGSGQGAGGEGGDGGGGGGGAVTPPRRIRGSLADADYPAGLGEAGISGRVSVLYLVQPDGRATDCFVTRSSGSPELDDTTCRLIETRFRFDPSRDRQGRPVRSRVAENHEWLVENLPPERRTERRRRWF